MNLRYYKETDEKKKPKKKKKPSGWPDQLRLREELRKMLDEKIAAKNNF